MRFPLLLIALLLLLAAVVASGIWWARTKQAPTSVWVANTASLRSLPAFRRQQGRTRTAIVFLVLLLAGTYLALAQLAAAPVDRRVENPTLAQRDLVLCLDASGSMLPYDGQILDRMRELVDQFAGERVALQLWSAQSVVKFSLTDDYELIDDVLSEAAQIIRTGYLGEDEDYVLVSAELFDYLQGVDAPDGERIASLIGDGLASCVLSFDHHDQERSRTIILATDNEVQGPQIYTLQQAVKFATDQNIDLIALYPAMSGLLTTEGEEMRDLIEAVGGSFYKVDDPGAVEGIIEEIQSKQLADTEGESIVVETDRPRAYALWAVWLSLGALSILVWRRL